jgi:hypothetical protein
MLLRRAHGRRISMRRAIGMPRVLAIERDTGLCREIQRRWVLCRMIPESDSEELRPVRDGDVQTRRAELYALLRQRLLLNRDEGRHRLLQRSLQFFDRMRDVPGTGALVARKVREEQRGKVLRVRAALDALHGVFGHVREQLAPDGREVRDLAVVHERVAARERLRAVEHERMVVVLGDDRELGGRADVGEDGERGGLGADRLEDGICEAADER